MDKSSSEKRKSVSKKIRTRSSSSGKDIDGSESRSRNIHRTNSDSRNQVKKLKRARHRSDSSRERDCKKKRKEKKKKTKKEKKTKKLKRKKEKNIEKESNKTGDEDSITGPMPPPTTDVKKRRAMVPMTKEEYERQQSKVRRVYDPDTGRNRLVKGDGEILEEVVSYQRHKEINKLATLGDGATFQKSLGLNH